MVKIVHNKEAADRLASQIKASGSKTSGGSLNSSAVAFTNLSGMETGKEEHKNFTALARRSGERSEEFAEKIKTVSASFNRLDANQARLLKEAK